MRDDVNSEVNAAVLRCRITLNEIAHLLEIFPVQTSIGTNG